jgi:hypothetical protein
MPWDLEKLSVSELLSAKQVCIGIRKKLPNQDD